MPLPVPEPGLVIGYAYLWRSQYDDRQEEGLKDRPCAIVLAARNAEGDAAVELPAATKQRLGLDDRRSWIIVSEVNRFSWPGPDLRPVSRTEPDRFDYGLLPPALFRLVKERLVACAKAQRLKAVPRTT